VRVISEGMIDQTSTNEKQQKRSQRAFSFRLLFCPLIFDSHHTFQVVFVFFLFVLLLLFMNVYDHSAIQLLKSAGCCWDVQCMPPPPILSANTDGI
jgi:hypothetical protein